MTRGQAEMIGVVAVAVLLIVGVLVYARVGGDTGGIVRSAVQEQEAESFLIALLPADVPRCGTTVEGVARACLERDTICDSADPCAELQRILDVAASSTLRRHGLRYNLSVEGTSAMALDDCESAERATLLLVRSRQEIIGSAGMPLGKGLSLAVCR